MELPVVILRFLVLRLEQSPQRAVVEEEVIQLHQQDCPVDLVEVVVPLTMIPVVLHFNQPKTQANLL